MNEKIERIKKHLHNNYKVYIAATAGVVVGIVTVLVILAIKSETGSDSPEIAQKAFGIWNTQVATLITIDAPGNSGNVIQDLTTGIIYPSQNAAAEALGINKATISKVVLGKIPEVNGHAFKKIIDGGTSHELHAV